MKKIFTLLFLFTLAFYCGHAQVIQSITMTPPNPTINDTITVYAECMFFSGGCDLHTQTVSIQGSQIYTNALHCIGPLAVICYHTDTFIINPLPVGNYSFIFQLDVGQWPLPCTPGIVAGPVDSLNFDVTLPVGIPEINENSEFTLYPNPAGNEITLVVNDDLQLPVTAEIFSVNGKLVKSIPVTTKEQLILLDDISAGQYFARIRSSNNTYLKKRISLTKLPAKD